MVTSLILTCVFAVICRCLVRNYVMIFQNLIYEFSKSQDEKVFCVKN